MRRLITFFITHGVAIGFALGIYFLPILTAPPSPDVAVLEAKSQNAKFTATLSRDLRGSDLLHWGEGTISLGDDEVVHTGKLAPGPDYVAYLIKEFVEHEDEFEPIKSEAIALGSVKTFAGFVLPLPDDVDLNDYTTVVIWCESFGEFITAAKYR